MRSKWKGEGREGFMPRWLCPFHACEQAWHKQSRIPFLRPPAVPVRREKVLSSSKYILREVLTHQQLSLTKHPHIVQFQELIVTPRYLGMVIEYLPGALNLQEYLIQQGGSLPEDVCRFIFQQVQGGRSAGNCRSRRAKTAGGSFEFREHARQPGSGV